MHEQAALQQLSLKLPALKQLYLKLQHCNNYQKALQLPYYTLNGNHSKVHYDSRKAACMCHAVHQTMQGMKAACMQAGSLYASRGYSPTAEAEQQSPNIQAACMQAGSRSRLCSPTAEAEQRTSGRSASGSPLIASCMISHQQSESPLPVNSMVSDQATW